ncbi:MAG: site-2 protease family protein [Candidatus Aenigmatarchaeota archaeon]
MELKEARDLIIAAVVLSAVFAYQGLNTNSFVANIPAAALGVALGFLLHELAHRFFARKYKCHAQFQLWPTGMMLAVVLAFVSNGSFIFAAPGAVMIHEAMDVWGNVTPLGKKRYGIVSLAGPAVNIVLAGIFFAAHLLNPLPIFSFAMMVNVWLAVFNMLPIPPLDGSKVLAWDKRIWAGVFIFLIAIFLLFGTGI